MCSDALRSTVALFMARISEGEAVASALGIQLHGDPRALVGKKAPLLPGKHKEASMPAGTFLRSETKCFMNGAIAETGEKLRRWCLRRSLSNAHCGTLVKGLGTSWSDPGLETSAESTRHTAKIEEVSVPSKSVCCAQHGAAQKPFACASVVTCVVSDTFWLAECLSLVAQTFDGKHARPLPYRHRRARKPSESLLAGESSLRTLAIRCQIAMDARVCGGRGEDRFLFFLASARPKICMKKSAKVKKQRSSARLGNAREHRII